MNRKGTVVCEKDANCVEEGGDKRGSDSPQNLVLYINCGTIKAGEG